MCGLNALLFQKVSAQTTKISSKSGFRELPSSKYCIQWMTVSAAFLSCGCRKNENDRMTETNKKKTKTILTSACRALGTELFCLHVHLSHKHCIFFQSQHTEHLFSHQSRQSYTNHVTFLRSERVKKGPGFFLLFYCLFHRHRA